MSSIRIENTFFIFVLKAVGLYLLWYIVYDVWIAPNYMVDQWLNESVAKGGYMLLQGFGFEVCRDGTSVCINNVSTVIIGRGCNGLEIYAIFAGFILIYSGSWKHKLWYIPLGVMLIYISNIVRVALLALDKYKSYHLFQFNHKYTYVFIIYFFVFMLWLIWINRFTRAQHEVSAN